jgi:hypothetical protein
MRGAQSHVSREAGRHGHAGTTARRVACLGGTEARRLAGVKHDGREHEHEWTTYGKPSGARARECRHVARL